MSKRLMMIEIALLLGAAAVLSWGTALENQQQRIAGSMVRLHVVANSDSESDQQIKLSVRDAVLEKVEPVLSDVSDAEEAERALAGMLTEKQRAASQRLRETGSDDTVSVSLCKELFDTRYYEGFALPGGYYNALRVTIGNGEGHNWWCVVYPQLCMAAVSEREAVAVMGGMHPDDVKTITETYHFRFRSLELFERLMGHIRSGES